VFELAEAENNMLVKELHGDFLKIEKDFRRHILTEENILHPLVIRLENDFLGGMNEGMQVNANQVDYDIDLKVNTRDIFTKDP